MPGVWKELASRGASWSRNSRRLAAPVSESVLASSSATPRAWSSFAYADCTSASALEISSSISRRSVMSETMPSPSVEPSSSGRARQRSCSQRTRPDWVVTR